MARVAVPSPSGVGNLKIKEMVRYQLSLKENLGVFYLILAINYGVHEVDFKIIHSTQCMTTRFLSLHNLFIGNIYIHISKHMACDEAKSAWWLGMPEQERCHNTKTRCRPRLQRAKAELAI